MKVAKGSFVRMRRDISGWKGLLASPNDNPAKRAKLSPSELAAAQTKYEAGALDDALTLLATAESGALGDLERARVDLLRAQVAFASGRAANFIKAASTASAWGWQ